MRTTSRPPRRRGRSPPPAAAAAHVTVQPSSAPAGGFARLDVRVPNERDDAGHGQGRRPAAARVRSPPPTSRCRAGRSRSTQEKLDTPVKVEGFEVDRADRAHHLDRRGKQGVIPPGAFRDFGLSVRMPAGQPGDKLTFKALQTYERRRGRALDRPRGRRRARPDRDAQRGRDRRRPRRARRGRRQHRAPPPPPPRAADDDGGVRRARVIALIVGALGLLAGIAGLLAARRARTLTTHPTTIEGAHDHRPPPPRRARRRRRLARPPGGRLGPRRDQVALAQAGRHARRAPWARCASRSTAASSTRTSPSAPPSGRVVSIGSGRSTAARPRVRVRLRAGLAAGRYRAAVASWPRRPRRSRSPGASGSADHDNPPRKEHANAQVPHPGPARRRRQRRPRPARRRVGPRDGQPARSRRPARSPS